MPELSDVGLATVGAGAALAAKPAYNALQIQRAKNKLLATSAASIERLRPAYKVGLPIAGAVSAAGMFTKNPIPIILAAALPAMAAGLIRSAKHVKYQKSLKPLILKAEALKTQMVPGASIAAAGAATYGLSKEAASKVNLMLQGLKKGVIPLPILPPGPTELLSMYIPRVGTVGPVLTPMPITKRGKAIFRHEYGHVNAGHGSPTYQSKVMTSLDPYGTLKRERQANRSALSDLPIAERAGYKKELDWAYGTYRKAQMLKEFRNSPLKGAGFKAFEKKMLKENPQYMASATDRDNPIVPIVKAFINRNKVLTAAAGATTVGLTVGATK